MITGLLLAAGRGRRLGGTKQLVPWPTAAGETKPLVAAAYDAIQPVCDNMIVVLGHEWEQIEAALAPRNFKTVNSDPDAQMCESIAAGLRALDRPSRVLLQPGDHPCVRPATLQALIVESNRSPMQAIVPTHKLRRGHPILIPTSIVNELKTTQLDGGLSKYWKKFPYRRVCLEVDDATIHRGVNTREELSRAIDWQDTN